MKFDGVEFAKGVRDVVRAVPAGMVLTYGEVAVLAGWPGRARMVGRILGAIGMDSDVPCHRIVNAQGRIAPHWPSQRQLLESEGVAFTSSGLVDMPRHHWHPDTY